MIVAPAFTSVGVTLVINGCNDAGGGDGSDDFVQPDGRIAANNTTMNNMHLIVLDGMAFSPAKVNRMKVTATKRIPSKL